MAYAATGLASASNQQNDLLPRVYSYKTADTKATVLAANYFAMTPVRLKLGDWIMCQCSNGGLIVYILTATTTTSTCTTVATA